jgi:putative Mg2+ transporter-C (MgtC) family protein
MFTEEVIIRLILSLILGGIIGIEREIRNQPAGFRTHSILSLGSCLYMLISVLSAEKYGKGLPADPTRVAAQVVSGIGFLCAGAIFRRGDNIKGLTTAASLWTTGGIGLACGMGLYFPAVISTLLLILTLTILAKFEKNLLLTKPKKSLYIEAERSPTLFADLEKTLNGLGYGMDFVEVEREKDRIEINMVIIPLPGKVYIEQHSLIVEEISKINGIVFVEIR